MTDFDKTTERKAEECPAVPWNTPMINGFKAGRSSAKESLEILAKAMEEEVAEDCGCGFDEPMGEGYRGGTCRLHEAIAAVKARGDWPLPEGGKERGDG